MQNSSSNVIFSASYETVVYDTKKPNRTGDDPGGSIMITLAPTEICSSLETSFSFPAAHEDATVIQSLFGVEQLQRLGFPHLHHSTDKLKPDYSPQLASLHHHLSLSAQQTVTYH